MSPSVVEKKINIGWNFDNSYARLSDTFYTRIEPLPVADPKIVIVNHDLAEQLGLDVKHTSDKALASLLSGSSLPDGVAPLAQAYAGHQFGRFTMLGDGRAHLLGEHLTPDGQRVDIQLKGSGRTPYARRGDGRAALGPMLREYIISEAMHALGIPTTRSLAVVTTGEPAYRETALQGAILTRVASSHLRVGTFEYLAVQNNVDALKQLADYTIDRHYPELKESATPYPDLVNAIMHRQIMLIVEWLRVGFIHGVMNTDNMALSGETIDYGPCAFMDTFNPNTVFSSIDQAGRYAYANQPEIAKWNIARFAEAILPLLHDDIEQAAVVGEKIIDSFNDIFQQAWLAMMRRKLGLFGEKDGDAQLIEDLLAWMQKHEMDYTNTFRALIFESIPEGAEYDTETFQSWWQRWQERLKENSKPLKSSFCLMRANNPAVIPRNHKVEEALSEAEQQSDFSQLHSLLDALAQPYKDKEAFAEYQKPPKPEQRVLQTFCGT